MSFVLGVIPSVVCVCEDGVAVGVVCNVVSLGFFSLRILCAAQSPIATRGAVQLS